MSTSREIVWTTNPCAACDRTPYIRRDNREYLYSYSGSEPVCSPRCAKKLASVAASAPSKSVEDSLSRILLSDLAYRRDAASSRKSSSADYWAGFEWGIIVTVCDILRTLEEDGVISPETRERLVTPFAA